MALYETGRFLDRNQKSHPRIPECNIIRKSSINQQAFSSAIQLLSEVRVVQSGSTNYNDLYVLCATRNSHTWLALFGVAGSTANSMCTAQVLFVLQRTNTHRLTHTCFVWTLVLHAVKWGMEFKSIDMLMLVLHKKKVTERAELILLLFSTSTRVLKLHYILSRFQYTQTYILITINMYWWYI